MMVTRQREKNYYSRTFQCNKIIIIFAIRSEEERATPFTLTRQLKYKVFNFASVCPPSLPAVATRHSTPKAPSVSPTATAV